MALPIRLTDERARALALLDEALAILDDLGECVPAAQVCGAIEHLRTGECADAAIDRQRQIGALR